MPWIGDGQIKAQRVVTRHVVVPQVFASLEQSERSVSRLEPLHHGINHGAQRTRCPARAHAAIKERTEDDQVGMPGQYPLDAIAQGLDDDGNERLPIVAGNAACCNPQSAFHAYTLSILLR